MYSKKQILAQARGARASDHIELAGMLEDYNRLKYSYLPQIQALIEAKGYHQKFPHMSKARELKWYHRILLNLLNKF